jgi:NADPH:quinone reductase
MRAVQINEYGPAENLKLVEVPIPEPAEDEVLIKVEAASVIFADSLMRRGIYLNLPSSLPFIPGREVAGIVEKVGAKAKNVRPDIAEMVGAKITNIKAGMRVMGFMHTGGYAEYAVASLKNVICLPDRVSFLNGLVYYLSLRIAYLAYYTFGKIQPYETILLHAPAGGIGTLITQIAKRRAHNVVIALSSSDEKLAYCRANGADYGINYRKSDYVEEVLRITGGKGVNISLNSVAGPTLKTDPRVIRPLGRWVIYGSAAGKGLIDIYEAALPKSLTLNIFSVYTVFEREEYRQATDFLENWLHTEELISVSKTFPLEDAIAAHHWMDEQRAVGKIALVMGRGRS